MNLADLRTAALGPRERDLWANPTVENVGDYLVQRVEERGSAEDRKLLEDLTASRVKPTDALVQLGLLWQATADGLRLLRKALERAFAQLVPRIQWSHAQQVIGILVSKASDLADRAMVSQKRAILKFDAIAGPWIATGQTAFDPRTLKFQLSHWTLDPASETSHSWRVITKASDQPAAVSTPFSQWH